MTKVTPGNEPTSTNLGTTSATFHEEVAEEERRVRLSNAFTTTSDMIEPSDRRLAMIWERAAEIATSRGYCAEFDSMMLALGTGYTRERHYYVHVEVTTTAILSIPVTCTGIEDPVNMLSVEDVEEYLCDGDFTLTEWGITEIVDQD